MRSASNGMNKITGIIIAKNDEKMIGQALDSLSFCDEIIVVDNGSLDRTKQIAESHKAIVYDFSSKSFSELRNFGLSKAKGNYILYLDTDERIDEKLKENIKKTVSENTNFAAFKLKRKNYYFGNTQWPYIEKLERLFLKEKLDCWKGELHESPYVKGEIGILDGYINHFTHRDLESMLNKTIDWSEKEALLRYNSQHPQMTWWRFPRVMITAFINSYIKQRGYKAGPAGIVESIYQSFSMFITYARLWELQQVKRIKSDLKL